MENNLAGSGVFLNGRAQVIEMLQRMPEAEREILLRNLRIKNSSLASELVEQSLSFNDLGRLADHDIKILINYTQAPIMGIAIKTVSEHFQRRILSLAPRPYAEEAFQTMMTPLPNEKRDIQRAQTKIVDTLVSLKKRNQVRFAQ